MAKQSLPDQPELRRRLRAARILADVTIADLADRLPAEAQLGERTLRKLENGETNLKPQTLRELANALGFPYSWFTISDIRSHLAPDEVDRRYAQFELDFKRRLEAVEAQLAGNGESPPSAAEPQPNRVRRSPRSSRPAAGRQ